MAKLIGEEPPVKRRRMTFNILMLPDDLLLNCLARISRLHYPIISLVSKRLRSILTSSELYQTRTLLGRTESCLYVGLSVHHDSKPLRWFTLCRRPNSSRKVLVPVSSPHQSLPEFWPAIALVGTNVYVIGGLRNKIASSSVMVMDCHSHTWTEAPSMLVPRQSPFVCVLDGKIYVVGSQKDKTTWMEVFDTKTGNWEFVPGPSEEICKRATRYRCIGYGGKVYVTAEKGDTYELNRGRWRRGPLFIDRAGFSSSFCVIDNVLYRCNSCMIDWYDSEENLWETVKGLKGLVPFYSGYIHAKAANHGGKMVILWEEKVYVNKLPHETKIWCAEITIERRQKEMWGTPDWFEVVLSTKNERFDQLSYVFFCYSLMNTTGETLFSF
ncbi:putative F-box/kelch-repeat protein At3g43710 [Brassica rapa]|uniref:F-box domain-containing protein n=1 Tax=Brassica campestris TaxID=3711 RepID=M4D496_BRACM|nr:putative F-box/kelch-repeat protein At3g43710 [Brassica rapa]